MEFYFAPLEGITGHIYRNACYTFFPQADKYFTPFISPNQKGSLNPKELKDVLPENNQGMYVVPQIMTNNSEYFIRTVRELKEYGYKEINLNLGCPSGTVVAKGKGAGFLAKREELDVFLNEIFTKTSAKLSIKTRIGKESAEEWHELLQIFNKYPIHELIIHPRIQTDYYKNKPNLKAFADAAALSTNRLCYNGDIFTEENYKNFHEKFPEVNAVMLGRGLLVNPGLVRQLKGGAKTDKKELEAFHNRIYSDYREILSGDTPVLFKMKELWFYMIHIFSDNEKYMKKIKKAIRLCDYEEAVRRLFDEQQIVDAH